MLFLNSSVFNENNYDVCIVGAGASGITLSLDLLKSDLRIALIETGGLSYSFKKQSESIYENVGINYSDIRRQCNKLFGGNTSIWGGNCIPLDKSDFLPFPHRNYFDWPLDYTEYQNYIIEAQKLLKIDKNSFDPEISTDQLPYLGDFSFKVWLFCKFPFHFGKIFKSKFQNQKYNSLSEYKFLLL